MDGENVILEKKGARVLVVDDEPNARSALRELLAEEGFEVQEAADGEEALRLLAGFAPDVVLADVRMPRMDGLTLLERTRGDGIDAAFVMMTAHGTVKDAVAAMKMGAENYLQKPLDMDAVLVSLGKALERRQLQRDVEMLRERVREGTGMAKIIGTSEPMRQVFELVHRAAPSRATVLVLGESGTGKELVAEALHDGSPRAAGPFIRVNCAALAETLLESELFGHEKGSFTGAIARKEGRFELADGGTLFLDEIGEITPPVQVKLLRFLQNREFDRVGGTKTLKVDVRVVAATNKDLLAEVKAGRFREDLYYRLNVVQIEMPPLRTRKTDLPALVDHFVRKYGSLYERPGAHMSREAFQAMLAYDWPGNVRELENAIERAVVLAPEGELLPNHLPPAVSETRRDGARQLIPGATLAEIEKEAIVRTLEVVDGSTSRAAEILGISVRTIQYRLKEYGMKSADAVEHA
jgi:two-component system NtrC family response regulator/two-component system response regulator HydG